MDGCIECFRCICLITEKRYLKVQLEGAEMSLDKATENLKEYSNAVSKIKNIVHYPGDDLVGLTDAVAKLYLDHLSLKLENRGYNLEELEKDNPYNGSY
jgi:hypothetical protein